MYKKSQEEMVGFGLIIVIVMIIIVFSIGFLISNNQKRTVQSEEVNGYLNSILQYTSDCEDYIEFRTIEKLIQGCISDEKCVDGRDMCIVLNKTISEISNASWKTKNSPVKAYKFLILDKQGREILKIEKGNQTRNSKEAMQNLHHSDIIFSVYY